MYVSRLDRPWERDCSNGTNQVSVFTPVSVQILLNLDKTSRTCFDITEDSSRGHQKSIAETDPVHRHVQKRPTGTSCLCWGTDVSNKSHFQNEQQIIRRADEKTLTIVDIKTRSCLPVNKYRRYRCVDFRMFLKRLSEVSHLLPGPKLSWIINIRSPFQNKSLQRFSLFFFFYNACVYPQKTLRVWSCWRGRTKHFILVPVHTNSF